MDLISRDIPGSVSSKDWGRYFPPPIAFSVPKLPPMRFLPQSVSSKKRPEKIPPFSPKNASSGGHRFWPPPARADFDSIQKLNKRH